MRNSKGCWLQCAAVALAMFCTTGLNVNAFTVYLPYLTKLLELTPNQSSTFLLVRSVVTLVGVYGAKYYYSKLEIKLGFSISLLMMAVSLILYASASNLIGLYAAAIMSGVSYGLGGMYPVAILIHRWFREHEGAAMGLCSASSGLAYMASPVITDLIERYSLPVAMGCESGFVLVCMIACFALLRNYPEGAEQRTPKMETRRHPIRFSLPFFAIVAIGTIGGFSSYIAIHYTAEGFGPYQISALISIIGILLIVGKFLLGELADLWGGFRANWLFLPIAITSCVAFGLGNSGGFGLAVAAVCLYGLGTTTATVGVTIYAKDLAASGEYEATQQQFQLARELGALISTMIPGYIATATGNYRGYFLTVAGLMLLGTVVIQYQYRKKAMSELSRVEKM